MRIRIVALRHAKPKSGGYAEDGLRPLSDEGTEKQKRLTKILEDKGMKPSKILTSPLLRAKQTAEIATDVFGVNAKDEPALGDAFDSQVLLSRLSECEEGATVFLVGHAPTLGDFVNQLVGENVLPDGLAKSSAAVIDFNQTPAFGKGRFIDYFKSV